MKTFKVALYYQLHGFIDIKAESLEEALYIAENDTSLTLPYIDESEYVEGSWEVDRLGTELANN